jgi:hypothetical protein
MSETDGGDVSRETSPLPELGPHHCSACGQIHGGEQRDSDAVRIAEIHRLEAVELARINRGEYEHAAELEAETMIEVAGIQAAAGVEETAALADGIASSGDAGDMPAIVDTPIPDAEPEVQASIEPRDDDQGDDGGPPDEPKSSGLSYWP